MQKTKLNKFIQKYNLGGNVNSVKWTSDSSKLTTSFVTPDKSLLGTVVAEGVTFEDGDLGVYQTDQLQKLLSVLGDDVNMSLTKAGDRAVSLKVKNGSVSVDYVLSDLSVIPDPPALKRLPDFQTKVKLDSSFIDTFIKGKGALADVDMFTFVNDKEGNLNAIIGYSSTNTNRVNIPVETEINGVTEPITFNANLFKEMLVANKDCKSAVLEVSNDGLAKVNFKVDDYDSTYYIVAMSDVD
ncbi:MAG: hypothetical protein H8D94_00285 [Candidatus Pelagibacter sp.]|nr:hypothetical protein [Candidatus Pelagibacter sp.]